MPRRSAGGPVRCAPSPDANLSIAVAANPPVIALMLVAVGTGLGAFALLMVVLKGLLRRAAGMRHEPSEVI